MNKNISYLIKQSEIKFIHYLKKFNILFTYRWRFFSFILTIARITDFNILFLRIHVIYELVKRFSSELL